MPAEHLFGSDYANRPAAPFAQCFIFVELSVPMWIADISDLKLISQLALRGGL